MRRTLFVAALVVVLLLAVPALAWAAGSVQGVVTGETGPLPQIGLGLYQNREIKYFGSGYTESDGAFSFSEVAPGDYILQANAWKYNELGGTIYRPKGIPVTVKDGDSLTINVSLEVYTPATFSRLAGPDRIATALEVSRRAYPSGADAVVIAYGFNFPDALTAGPLAKAYGAPVLLTATDGLRADVLAELTRLAPKKVFIAGSDKVVSGNVETQLAALPSAPNITRFAGVDRFDTAAQIADALRAKAGAPTKVVVVNGGTFADALSVGPLAASKGWPILLTRLDDVPASTADAIKRSGATASLVIGDQKVVSDSVMASLSSPQRLAGLNRYYTCDAVVEYALSQSASYKHIAFAKGTDFPDALAAGPYLGADNGLLYLSRPDYLMVTPDKFTEQKLVIQQVDFIGSPVAISEDIVNQVKNALK